MAGDDFHARLIAALDAVHPPTRPPAAHEHDQEHDMTSPTKQRHDELVALLTDIRDALRPRTTGIVHAATVNGREFSAALKRASTPEPVDVTEEPPVGSQVTDSGRDVWQRFEAGWTCWNRHDSQWGLGMCVDFRWSNLRNFAPLHLTTDADRERVGLLVDTAPDVDPDEALAKVMCRAWWGGDVNPAIDDEAWSRAARAAREHIEAEREEAYLTGKRDPDQTEQLAARVLDLEAELRDENQQAEAWLRIVRHPVIANVPTPRDGRSFVEAAMDHLTDLEADVERLTRERDDFHARIDDLIRERGQAIERHKALRADVEAACQRWPRTTSRVLAPMLRRDDERGRTDA